MAITIATDKQAIQTVLTNDPYLKDFLGFQPKEYYRVRATNEIIGDGNTQQIFIYNVNPEATINPIIYGVVYEIDISVPFAKNGTADLAMEQIVALLNGCKISPTHKLEILDPPLTLASDTSLYQMGVRFICYDSIYNKIKRIDS